MIPAYDIPTTDVEQPLVCSKQTFTSYVSCVKWNNSLHQSYGCYRTGVHLTCNICTGIKTHHTVSILKMLKIFYNMSTSVLFVVQEQGFEQFFVLVL